MKLLRKKWFRITGFVVLTCFLLILFFYLRFRPSKNIEWGVSFSQSYAEYLGFDWKIVYQEILDELQPKKIRIMAYWNKLEPSQGQFYFQDIDYMLAEAQKHDIQVMLVLGHKQPRWPECHHPGWYENLSAEGKNQAVLEMLKQAISHFRQYESIVSWQIENEPFFNYGPRCQPILKALFKQELAIVKKLDPRPLVVTDSGEKGAWLPLAWTGGDIFGSTMYHQVYHDKKQRYINYPIPPMFYRIRAGMVQSLTRIRKIYGVELQAEPWFAGEIFRTSWDQQKKLMNPNVFMGNINYAKKVGFKEYYFWGAEWWYWAKAQGHSEMWESAKNFLTNL